MVTSKALFLFLVENCMVGKNGVAVCGEHGNDIETVETKTNK